MSTIYVVEGSTPAGDSWIESAFRSKELAKTEVRGLRKANADKGASFHFYAVELDERT